MLISYAYRKKRMGPRTVPCGTQNVVDYWKSGSKYLIVNRQNVYMYVTVLKVSTQLTLRECGGQPCIFYVRA